MKKTLLFEFLIVIVVILAGVAGFQYFDWSGVNDAVSISVEREEKFGAAMVDEVNKKYPEISNPTLDKAMLSIKQRLLEKLPDSRYQHRILVVKSDVINAVTLPGGYILVFSELIKITDSPEELASVIAHEIGHTEERHVVKRLVKALGIEIFAAVLGGDAILLGEVWKTIASTVFDRSQEREADNFAMKLMTKTKINPHILARFFGKIRDQSGSNDLSDKFEFVSTHPATQSRIKDVLQYTLPKDFKEEKMKINWARVKRSL